MYTVNVLVFWRSLNNNGHHREVPLMVRFLPQIQMTQPLKLSYSEKLGKLESQYGRLLVSFHSLFMGTFTE